MNEPDQALNTIERHVYTRQAANYSYLKPKFAKEVRWTWCDFEGELRTYATKKEAVEAKAAQDAELAEEI